MKRTKENKRNRIHLRIRKRIKGTAERPRLNVFRSNKSIYAQIIDDVSGHTLAAASSLESSISKELNKSQQAAEVGKLIASRCLEANVSNVVFDRGGYLYHGRVKALADGAREGGLKF